MIQKQKCMFGTQKNSSLFWTLIMGHEQINARAQALHLSVGKTTLILNLTHCFQMAGLLPLYMVVYHTSITV